jgi:hypothetical protein
VIELDAEKAPAMRTPTSAVRKARMPVMPAAKLA